MRSFHKNATPLLITLLGIVCLTCMPAISQQTEETNFFPNESFVELNPTLPNSKLDFGNESQESCCAKDYTSSGRSQSSVQQKPSGEVLAGSLSASLRSEFERSNPRYLENSTPAYLVSCERFASLPELTANALPSATFNDRSGKNSLAIESYSTNVSMREGAEYFTDSLVHNTSDFHIETAGGDGQVKLQDVNSYSVCMGGGNNVAMIANTDHGSVLSYNGSDHVYLSGNNTSMLTRTGAGEDLIELYQARPSESETSWSAYNLYKTAISGGSETDTLVIKGTPVGTKWCHIGGYRAFGEYFYVVEFALPPSVVEGPRRQRVNIGESVEYVVIKGKKYQLNDFLVHGVPVDSVARSVPIGDPLPRVAVR